MQFLLPLIYFIIFLFLILKMKFFRFEGLNGRQLCGLFLVKCIAGISVWLVYTYYYPSSDFHLYFSDSKKIFDSLFSSAPGPALSMWNGNFDDSFFNNSRIVIIVNVVLQLLSFNNIFVHILFFCFFAFVGLAGIYKAFRKYCPDKNYALVIGIFLVPSALFWTAGIYKGTLSILLIGLLIDQTEFGLRKEYSRKQLVVVIILLLLLFFLKMHIAGAMIIALAVIMLHRKMQSSLWMSLMLVGIPLVLLLYSASMISPRLDVFRMIADKQAKAISEAEGGKFLLNENNFVRVDYYDEDALTLQPDSSYRIAAGTNYLSWKPDNMKDTTYVRNSTDSSSFHLLYSVMPANTFYDIRRMEPTLMSLLKALPFAVGNALFRPALFEVHNIMHLFAALENTWLLILIVMVVICFDKKCLQCKEVIVFCLLFALIQLAVIGLTTPAAGAIIRYKATALPFLVTALLLCLDLSKLGRLGSSVKKKDS